ncbi:hypothetical protein GCM10007415_00500 [Parapedobacter pyrenivorans]|uniref:Uncharacterized protein n=1 Tax=Parapedobacter pyrenivorans TaxID=1305674 RepID=A0A917M3L1_9SPHI|nr:hypothetical protein [Parapedobacter pyrenivorans]GGG73065.1 hypothetical protein GCM10007415_00500 [Parapedobacter pyrenivorans]
MRLTDEQLKKLLQEQAETEERQLAPDEIDAYTLLFESLRSEKENQSAATSVDVANAVMAEIALLEERRDRNRDLVTVILALCLGVLATSISYYFVDYPLLKAGLFWLKANFSVVLFVIIAVCLIQFADKKLVLRR